MIIVVNGKFFWSIWKMVCFTWLILKVNRVTGRCQIFLGVNCTIGLQPLNKIVDQSRSFIGLIFILNLWEISKLHHCRWFLCKKFIKCGIRTCNLTFNKAKWCDAVHLYNPLRIVSVIPCMWDDCQLWCQMCRSCSIVL